MIIFLKKSDLDYLQNQILNTYQDAGFERIMTPAVEDIEKS